MSQSKLLHRSDVSDNCNLLSSPVGRIGAVPDPVVDRNISYSLAQSLIIRDSDSLLRGLNGEQILPDLLRYGN